MADTYQAVLQHFPYAKILGVTATPDRSDKKSLADFFDDVAYRYSIVQAMKEHYLTNIHIQMVPVKINLKGVHTVAGDFSADDVGTAIDPYLEEIATQIKHIAPHRHTVIFLPLVSTAKKMEKLLKKNGMKAKAIDGKIKPEERNKILDDFERGKYNVLCNAMLLTEGWDCPRVDCIINLRATKSRALYAQIIGRGTRLCDGKDHLLVIDFLWLAERMNLCTPANLIAEDEKTQERINRLIKAGKEIDLMDANQEAEKEKEAEIMEKLRLQLARAAAKHKEATNIDILEMVAFLGLDELYDYVPVFKWEMKKPTEGQLTALSHFGLSTASIQTRGIASKTLDILIKRAREHKCTLRQLKQLRQARYEHAENFTCKEER